MEKDNSKSNRVRVTGGIYAKMGPSNPPLTLEGQSDKGFGLGFDAKMGPSNPPVNLVLKPNETPPPKTDNTGQKSPSKDN